MEIVLSILMGIGLSAACGFRIFIPLLIISIASLAGHLELNPTFEWIGTYPALIVFAVASILEIAAYYIPWVDNLLNTIATPTAIIAGVIVSASFITDMSPLLTWTLAIIAGGGAATITQVTTTAARGVSTVTTGGIGNFVISIIEAVGAFLTSILAIVAPILCVIGLAGMFVILFKIIKKIKIKRQER